MTVWRGRRPPVFEDLCTASGDGKAQNIGIKHGGRTDENALWVAAVPEREPPKNGNIERPDWTCPYQTGHSAWLGDLLAMNSRGERMRKPECGWMLL